MCSAFGLNSRIVRFRDGRRQLCSNLQRLRRCKLGAPRIPLLDLDWFSQSSMAESRHLFLAFKMKKKLYENLQFFDNKNQQKHIGSMRVFAHKKI